jgi:hypothetical protein
VRRHLLMDIVIVCVLAVVAGADGWSDIVQFAEDRQDWFSTFSRIAGRDSPPRRLILSLHFIWNRC